MPTVHVYFRSQLTADAATVKKIADAAEKLRALIAGVGQGGDPGSVTVVGDDDVVTRSVLESAPSPDPVPAHVTVEAQPQKPAEAERVHVKTEPAKAPATSRKKES